MNPPELSAPENPPYRDRKTWLVVFGAATAGAGMLCGLFLLLASFAAVMNPAQARPPVPKSSLGMIVGIYGALAIALVCLGIGSIMARRWARALLLIWSWVWLIGGVGTTIVLAWMLPHLPPPPVTNRPPPPIGVIYTVMLALCGFFGILLPLIWLLFYRRRDVRLTCEARDPQERWTDRCPLPVLALSLWQVGSAVSFLAICFTTFRVLPFFGLLLSGPAAAGCFVVMALLHLFAARAIFRREWPGWWIALLLPVLYALSSTITALRHGLREFYVAMHYPPETIAHVMGTGFLEGPWATWGPVVFVLPVVGYLFFVRRYFRPTA